MKFFKDMIKLSVILGVVLWLLSRYETSNTQTVKSVGRAIVAKLKKPVQYKQLYINMEQRRY